MVRKIRPVEHLFLPSFAGCQDFYLFAGRHRQNAFWGILFLYYGRIIPLVSFACLGGNGFGPELGKFKRIVAWIGLVDHRDNSFVGRSLDGFEDQK